MSIGSNSNAQDALVSFASEYDPTADLPALPEQGLSQQSNEGLVGQIISVAGMLVAGAASFGGIFYLYKKIINRSNASEKTTKQTITSELVQVKYQTTFRQGLNRLETIFRELTRYPSAVAGMIILMIMVTGSLYAVIRYPYQEIGMRWYQDASDNSYYIPRIAYPKWINWFRKHDFPETIIINNKDFPETKTVKYLDNGNPDYNFTFTFDYPYQAFPSEGMLYFQTTYESKKPFATFIWRTPDGREFQLKNSGIKETTRIHLDDSLDIRDLADHKIRYKFNDYDTFSVPVLHGLFADPDRETPVAIPGTYTLEIKVLSFEPDTQVDVEMVLMGEVYGLAGTDFMRRDLVVPMLWGMPFALGIGLFGALLTTIVSMLFAAFGVWFGGWADALVQRVTEANMILPVVAIAVLFYAFYGASLWAILTVIVILNAFGSPTKTFRAAFIQVKEASYIEAAQAYGAPNSRIIFRYMIPRILPVLIPQLVTLIPGFIFLEATLGMFNVKSNLPTWGKVIYEALSHGAAWGSKFWVLEPIALLLLTGFAFSMMGFALDRVLNPRLQQGD
jgi:peptide/nickel transport system permease protein